MSVHMLTRQEHVAELGRGLDALARLLATKRLLSAAETSAATLTLATVKMLFDGDESVRDRLAQARLALLASAEAADAKDV